MTNDPLYLDQLGEWAGLWWLPDDFDNQVPGVLRYDSESGLTLSLIGSFEDRIMTMAVPGVEAYQGRRTWDVLHGVAEQREITLLDCVPISDSRTYGPRVKSPDKQTIKAGKALVGAHISDEDEKTLSVAKVSVEDLTHWAASSVFTMDPGTTDDTFDGTARISTKQVEPQSVWAEGIEFHLEHSHTRPFFDKQRGKTIGRMRDTAFIRMVPSDLFSLEDAVRLAGLVQDLISLATHRAAGLLWLQLDLIRKDGATESDKSSSLQRVEVLYSPLAVGKPEAKAIAPHRVFFTCATLPFEEIVPRWLEAHERLQAATNMLLGLRYAPARFIENNLLTAVGAAEVLHRCLDIDEPPIPPGEFKEMRELMLAQVPEEYRDKIRAAVRNDPTLRDRLYALADRPDQEAISLLIPDVEQWARQTTRARNNLAHKGKTLQHPTEELAAIVHVTTAVVLLNVLNELGLPAEHQHQVVQEHPELRRTAELAQEWLVASPEP